MTTFDDRERQEETRFKHQQELAFKARNRGNKMFGLWVAEQLGLSGAEDRATDNPRPYGEVRPRTDRPRRPRSRGL